VQSTQFHLNLCEPWLEIEGAFVRLLSGFKIPHVCCNIALKLQYVGALWSPLSRAVQTLKRPGWIPSGIANLRERNQHIHVVRVLLCQQRSVINRVGAPAQREQLLDLP
jgi:hypothetical protein